jgi:hypothetical protein
VGVDWERSHCQLAVSVSVLVCATFSEVPTSGHAAASYVSSVSGCKCTQRLFHFAEYIRFALSHFSDADFYQRNFTPLHPAVPACLLARFTNSLVATVTTAVNVVDMMC